MAFWNKNGLPPELRELPAEEIAKRLKAAEDKAAEADALKTKTTELEGKVSDLTAKTGEMDALKVEVEALRKKSEGGEQVIVPEAKTPGLAEWLSAPEKAFDDSFNARVAPLTMATLMNGALTARMHAAEFVQKQGPVEKRLWNKYFAETEALVSKMSPEQRIYPQTWINQYTFVKGMHLDDVVKDAQKEGDAFFSEGVTPGGGGFGEHRQDSGKLTDMELHVAKSMKMKPEDYLARKKTLKIVSA